MSKSALGRLVIKSRGLRGEIRGWFQTTVVGNDRIEYVRQVAKCLGISEVEFCQRLLHEKLDADIRNR